MVALAILIMALMLTTIVSLLISDAYDHHYNNGDTISKEDKKSFDTVYGRSIADSCFLLLIMIIRIIISCKWNLKKEISRYRCDVEEADVAYNQQETGWKNIHGDVFRFPKHKSLFAAALGSGTQLLVLTIVILILGVMGVFHPYLQGDFFHAFIIVYAVTSVVAGYTSVSFYHQLEGTNWMKNLFLTGGLYIGPLFLTFSFNNTIAIFNRSTNALPLGDILTLSLWWIILALPLLLLGVLVGKNNNADFHAPCTTSKCPREVPQLPWYRGTLPQMFMAGFFPFSVIKIQLHDMVSTLTGHGGYISYSYMSIMFFLLLIMTALVTMVMTYFQLAAEDHKWWLRSFLYGGSTGLYVYGYSIYYYFCLSDINGFTQTSFFFGYIACLSYGIFLLLGTVGFHASLRFVRFIYDRN